MAEDSINPKLIEEISKRISVDVIGKVMENLKTQQQVTPVANASSGHEHGDMIDVKPMKRGHFDVEDISEDKEEVYCPSCGLTEIRKKPVLEKVVTKIPDNYVPEPDSVEGVLPWLERKHTDGKTIWECPVCSKALSDFMDKHVTDIKKIGYDVKRVKK